MRTFELDVARCVHGEGPGQIASTIPALQNELRPPSKELRRFRRLAAAIRTQSSHGHRQTMASCRRCDAGPV
jgi:hypothetical protein